MAINWAELKDLHVISKIQELITQWFNAEIFFTDLSGQVMSGNWNKEHDFKNQFLAVLNLTSDTFTSLGNDFESFFDNNLPEAFILLLFPELIITVNLLK